MKSYTLLISLVLFWMAAVTGCGNSTEEQQTDIVEKKEPSQTPALLFDKIVGTWQNEDGKSFERWQKNLDGTYESKVFGVKGSDTIWKETAKIFPENESWVFENIVSGQNNGKATRFTSTLLNEKSVQFTNAAHDFPTDINYTVTNDSTISAFIIGPNSKGGKDTIPFNYKRIQ